LVTAARVAAARQEAAEYQRVVSVLKNHLALLSTQAAYQAAGWAELAGQTQSLEQAGEGLAQLEEELEHLRPALANLGKEVAR
jgi:uncharacterized protein involved in exopolysaccharide biosynthesis